MANKGEEKKKQIEIIFHLVQQFKDSYYQEKHDKGLEDQSEESSARPSISPLAHPGISPLAHPSISPLAHPIITSEFKSQERHVNIIVNFNREDDSLMMGSSKCDSGEKEKSSNNDKFLCDNDPQLNILDLEEPSPLTHINEDRTFLDLVIVGHHWSPARDVAEREDKDIDEIL